jgi:hypothetical protein
LWDYQRGVWQYDIICGLILAFIFFAPHDWFRDQPISPSAFQITSMPAREGELAFWVQPEVVTALPEEKRQAGIAKILEQRARKKLVVTHLEAIPDSEGVIIGYMAYAKP